MYIQQEHVTLTHSCTAQRAAPQHDTQPQQQARRTRGAGPDSQPPSAPAARGRRPSFWAVQRPARPHKTPVRTRFAVEAGQRGGRLSAVGSGIMQQRRDVGARSRRSAAGLGLGIDLGLGRRRRAVAALRAHPVRDAPHRPPARTWARTAAGEVAVLRPRRRVPRGASGRSAPDGIMGDEARRGEARRAVEMRRGETRRGEVRRGEVRRGEVRRGEAR